MPGRSQPHRSLLLREQDRNDSDSAMMEASIWNTPSELVVRFPRPADRWSKVVVGTCTVIRMFRIREHTDLYRDSLTQLLCRQHGGKSPP